MAIFKCKMCGGQVTVKDNETTAECEYCGTKQIVPAEGCTFIDGGKEYKDAVAIKKKKIVRKKLIFIGAIVLGIVAVIGLLFATHIICFHSYSDATVLKPQTCYYCDKTIGETKPLTEIDFPKKGLATLLPTPKSDMGFIDTDSTTYIEIYIGEMSMNDFNAYVDECSDMGFNIDYRRYDRSSFGYEYYHAKDPNGSSLELRYYENLEILEIRVYAP